MLILWTTVVTMAVLAGAQVLPVAPALPDMPPLPVDIKQGLLASLPSPSVPLKRPAPTDQTNTKQGAKTSKGKCSSVASFYIADTNLVAGLNETLPEKIQKILTCSELNLGGVLGEVISSVSGTDLGSLLGGGGSGGLTGSLLGGGGSGGLTGSLLGGGGSGGLTSSLLGGGKGGGLTSSLLGGGKGGGLTSSLLGGGGLTSSLLGGGSKGGLTSSLLGSGGSAGPTSSLLGGGATGGLTGSVLSGGPKIPDVASAVAGNVAPSSVDRAIGGGLQDIPAANGLRQSLTANTPLDVPAAILSRDVPVARELLDATARAQSNIASLPAVQAGAKVVDNVKDSALGTAKNAAGAVAGVSGLTSGLTSSLDLKALLLVLKAGDVRVADLNISTTDGEIQALASFDMDVTADGALGTVISVLSFKVRGKVTLKLTVSTNNTQCLTLQVSDTSISVDEVTVGVLETVTGLLPVDLPLDSVVSTALTVSINEKLQDSESCRCDFSDFNVCKNSTGVFEYRLNKASLSPAGIVITYCAKAKFNKGSFPVIGGALPTRPKNVNVSVTLSPALFKAIVAQSAHASSTKMGDMEASISKVTYTYQPGNKITFTLLSKVKGAGAVIGKGTTKAVFTLALTLENDKVVARAKSVSSDHSLAGLSGAAEDVPDVVPAMAKKFSDNLIRNMGNWNAPSGISSAPINSAPLKVIPGNFLVAAK